MPFEEILEKFSTKDNVLSCLDNTSEYIPQYIEAYMFQELTKETNVIPLPANVKTPTKYDKVAGKARPIEFRVNWMYRNDHFKDLCNAYYSKYDLTFHFQNVSRDKWKLTLRTKNGVIINPRKEKCKGPLD